MEKWPQYEFLGKPIKRANGKTYVRARYKTWPWEGHCHLYCIEDDWFWHGISVSDVPS